MNEVGMERVTEQPSTDANPLSHMDFYQADPFSHCQNERMYKNPTTFNQSPSSFSLCRIK